jgi:integrase
MARRLNRNPSYLHHRQSGKARVVVHAHDGSRKEILLPGLYDSKESLDEYHRVLAQLRAGAGRLPAPKAARGDLTIAELILRYMEQHAQTYYVDEAGQPTSEQQCLRDAYRVLNRLYGSRPVAEFDSLTLESVQAAMGSGTWLTEEERVKRTKRKKPWGLARTSINGHVERIKRLFRWGCLKKLVDPLNLVNVETVPSLRAGRGGARESEAVAPVKVALVEATLPLLPPVPADILRVLLLTGARVGEVTRMIGAELDRSGPIWLFSPRRHKGRHRGQARVIAIGPQAQLVLRKYLRDDPEAFFFSPAEAEARRLTELRAKRKTPVQPSQVHRRKKRAKHLPGATYNHNAINTAIRRACFKAGLERWHCHQLRHTASLTILRECGAEAARSTLGHKGIDMTLHYSGVDLERAKDVASKIG